MVGQSGRTYERYEGRAMTKGDRDGRMFQTDSSDVIMYANPSQISVFFRGQHSWYSNTSTVQSADREI